MTEKKTIVKKWQCHLFYFTARKTKTNMLFMDKEQNVYVISFNTAEIIEVLRKDIRKRKDSVNILIILPSTIRIKDDKLEKS